MKEIDFIHLNSVEYLEYEILKKINKLKNYIKNQNLSEKEQRSFEDLINLLNNCFDFIHDVAKDVEKFEMSKIIIAAQYKRISQLKKNYDILKIKYMNYENKQL